MAAPPPGDPPVPASSPDLLEQELPTVLQDLVPLGYLVDRVVAQAYSDLATLVETLPSHSDQLRKRALVDYVLHTRRQLVKLLVLTRWSTEAKPIHKAMNLVGFLSRQNHAVDSAVSALDHAATQLAGARLRNYDLDSALSVLTSGTYPALPLALSQPFTASGPLTDADVVATLHDVDAVLRWRLVMRLDHVPLAMRRVPWRVADGRVVFTIPGLWEAAFTYGGAADDPDEDEPDARAHEGAEWFLLRVKFLFRVRDARGTWNPSPTGPLKEHLVDMCNRELLRRPALPPPAAAPAPAPESAPAGADPALALPDGGAAPPPADGPKPAINGDGSAAHGAAGAQEGEGEGEDGEKARRAQEDERREAVRKRRRDRPLDRAYTFLQRLALSYQLEAVAASAARLAATSWSGHLSVEVSAERDEVRVGYWTHRPEMPPQQQQQRPPPSTAGAAQRPGPGGTLVFSVRAPVATAAPGPAGTSAAPPVSIAQAREDALQAALAAASSTSSVSALASAPVDAEPASSSAAAVPAALSVTWLPPSFPTPSSSLDPALSPHSPLALDCDLSLPADLDLEPLLRRVTARHARETVRRLGEVVREAGEAGAQVVFDDGASADDEDDDQEGYDGEEQDERALRVPHVRIPLLPSSAADLSPSTSTTAAASIAAAPPRQALAAHIDPRTGRFELRTATSSVSSSAAGAGASATADEAGAEGGGARAQRLRAASERIDRERFAAAGLGGPAVAVSAAGQGERDEGWMRAVGDVVARIRASTILDDLDTLLSLLALPLAGPTTRRLPLPARELAKLGPNPALQSGRSALLFVPLVVPGSRGSSATLIGSSAAAGAGATAPRDQWFVAFVLFDEGLRAALVRAREASDGMNAFLEVGEVGWLGRAEGPASAGAGAGERGAEGGRAGEGEGARKGANLGYEIRGETVLGLWGQCVHRVALFDLERQLSARRIPYRLSTAPPSTSSPAPPPTSFLGKDPTTTPRPFLLVHSASLVRLPEAERFVARDAALQCAVDGQGRIRTTLHLCFRLPLPPGALPDPSELPPGVLWNPKRGVLVLAVDDALDSSVERLLRAYALALRTVAAAAHAAAAAAQPTSPSKKRSGPTTATPKAQLKGLPNGTGT
ncbi:hypothetical protein JCM9279_006338 [Rhodotorula babjevae]